MTDNMELIAESAKVELTDEEKQTVTSYAHSIDIRDSQMVLQYGAGAQKKISDFSETALKSVRTKDLGEIGTLLGNVVSELKSFDVTEEKGIFGFFKKEVNKVQSIKARYDKAETNVNNCMPVQLPSGAVRTGLNLQDNPGNLGKQVLLNGNIEKYFGATGIKTVKYAEINGTSIGTKP